MVGNMDAVVFHFGLEEVGVAYRASRDGLRREKRSAEATMRERCGLASDDPIEEGEAGECGLNFAEGFWEQVGDLEREAEIAETVIRGAFIIALFHFWERQTNRWLQRKRYEATPTIAFLQAHGRTPDAAQLELLHHLANCLKHGPGTSCDLLQAMAPQLFDPAPTPASPASDEDLRIDDALVEGFLKTIQNAGPGLGKTPWAVPK